MSSKFVSLLKWMIQQDNRPHTHTCNRHKQKHTLPLQPTEVPLSVVLTKRALVLSLCFLSIAQQLAHWWSIVRFTNGTVSGQKHDVFCVCLETDLSSVHAWGGERASVPICHLWRPVALGLPLILPLRTAPARCTLMRRQIWKLRGTADVFIPLVDYPEKFNVRTNCKSNAIFCQPWG